MTDKLHPEKDTIEFLQHRFRIFSWVELLIMYAILLLVVRVMYLFFDYIETPSIVAILSIVAALVVIGAYIINTASKHAINKIDSFSGKLNTLLDTAKDIQQMVYGDVLMENILERAIDVIGSDAGSILLVEEDRLVFRMAAGSERNKLIGLSIPKNQGIVGWVVENASVLHIENVKDDSRFYSEVDRVTGYETHSILCAPLIINSHAIGALELLNKKQGFTPEDEKLLSYFADQISIAVARTKFFQEHKHQSRQIENILNIIEERIDEKVSPLDK